MNKELTFEQILLRDILENPEEEVRIDRPIDYKELKQYLEVWLEVMWLNHEEECDLDRLQDSGIQGNKYFYLDFTYDEEKIERAIGWLNVMENNNG